MAYPRTIRNFNAFLDGISYMGKVSKGALPAMKLKTSAARGAGMDGEVAVDQGMEAMQAMLTFDEWVTAAFKLFGTKQRIVLRPTARGEDDFSADTYIFTCGGRISGNEPDELGAGDDAKLKMTMDIDFYSVEINGEEVVKIDIENGVRIIDGVDQLAEMRRAMGL